MRVEAVLKGEGSVDDVFAKHNISARSALNRWISLYNANMGLKDYEPKREAYMIEARRKTTLEERKEIVKYCIAYGMTIKVLHLGMKYPTARCIPGLRNIEKW